MAEKKQYSILKKIAKWLMWIVIAVISLLLVVILLLNIPAVQTFITGKISKRLSEQTGTEMRVGAVKIAFPKTVHVQDVYMEDLEDDTLLFLGSIRVNIDLPALLNQKINVKSLRLNDLHANVDRSLSDSAFNFQFILDSLSSSEPDTTPSKPWDFTIRDIYLSDFDVGFRDELSGIDAALLLGKLNIFMKDFDPGEMRFGVKTIELSNTSAKLVQWNVPGAQTASNGPAGDADTSALPALSLGRLDINNVDLVYRQKDEESHYESHLGELVFEPDNIDLNDKTLDLGTLLLQNSRLAMAVNRPPESAGTGSPAESAPIENISDVLPDWNLSIKKLSLEDLAFHYDVKNEPAQPQGFDPNHISLTEINLELTDVNSTAERASLDLENLSFISENSIGLNRLTLIADISDENLDISSFIVKTGGTSFDARINLDYPSLGRLINDPAQARVSLDISPSQLYVGDAVAMAPQLLQDSLIRSHRYRTVGISTQVSGSLGNINLSHLNLSLANRTSLAAGGTIRGLPDTENLAFDFSLDSLVTTDDDLRALLDTSYFQGLTLPENIVLSASAEGSTDSLQAKAGLQTSIGGFTADAMYSNRGKSVRDTFHLDLSIPEFKAGVLLADTSMGSVAFETTLAGTGATTDSIFARLDGSLKSLYFNNYNYEDIKIDALMEGDTITANINSSDENLDFTLNGEVVSDSAYQHLMVQLTLRKVHLTNLNFAQNQLVAKSNIDVNIRYGGITDIDARVEMTDTEIVQNQTYIPMQQLIVDAKTTTDSTRLNLTSDYIEAKAKANVRIDSLQPLIMGAFGKYISRQDTIDLPKGKEITANIDLHLPDDLKERLIPNLKTLTMDTLRGTYSSTNNEMKIDLLFPKIDYSQINLDSLYLTVSGKLDSVSIAAGFENLAYDTIGMDRFRVQGELKAGRLLSNITGHDVNDQPSYIFSNEIQFHQDSIRISFQPEGLMMDGGKWKIDENNSLVLRGNRMEADGFSFTNGQQEIAFVQAPDSVYLKFDQFRINNLINIIKVNERQDVIAGRIDGTLSIPQKDTLAGGFEAYITIDSLMLMDSLAGDLDFVLQNNEEKTLVNVSLENPYNSLSLTGNMTAAGETSKLDLEADVEINALERFERFTFGQLSNMSGSVLGDIDINGTTVNPLINGRITFKNAAFNITSLNFNTELKNESVRFDRQGIHLNDFTIEDPQGNSLRVDGSLLTEDYSGFNFDLRVEADRFQPVNSTEKDNERFYGDLFISTTTTIKGNSSLPVISSSVSIEDGTDLTYVMPGSEISMVDHEGIVRFSEPTFAGDTVSIRDEMQYLTDSVVTRVSGLNLDAKIELDPGAKFTVVVDQISGDYATVNGVANLNFSMDQSGSRSMTGVFEVRDGFYQISFYGLIKKEFLFQPGSSISWSGRLMDASIDFTAKHIVRTQSVNLIANESTGLSEAERNMYKQRLPYEVLLNIDGFISEPEISFGLDLPQKYQVNYPQIATKLSMLNSEEMNSELNKQVFALLVTGSFIPDNPFATGEGGSQGIATTAARNSVNGILSAQLNKLSSKYVKGFEINFDLTTYDDYSGDQTQTRTELDVEVQKKLFDERLTVEASSTFDLEGDQQTRPGGTSQQLYGEFAVTYDLTESGDYKLRAYRENAYDIFDGEVAYSGLAFIIQKSFNKLANIFKKEEPDQKAIREDEEDQQPDKENEQNQSQKNQQK